MKTWYETARFGMFVHWGDSSQRSCELSWPLVGGVFSLAFCDKSITVRHKPSTRKITIPMNGHTRLNAWVCNMPS